MSPLALLSRITILGALNANTTFLREPSIKHYFLKVFGKKNCPRCLLTNTEVGCDNMLSGVHVFMLSRKLW